MPLHPTWVDIAVRLALTVLAGGVVGFNRGVRGHAAGLRTTILVALAASVAMIQANILLPIAGKMTDSFGVMDLMRLPLGILTGVGFIGGGAILRRGDFVTGVTTAATLWVMTVIGLCFGGGQIILGIAATLIGVFILWALRWLDLRISRQHRAMLVIRADSKIAEPPDLDGLIRPLGYRARFHRQTREPDPQHLRLFFEIHWKRPETDGPPYDLLKRVAETLTVESFELGPETDPY